MYSTSGLSRDRYSLDAMVLVSCFLLFLRPFSGSFILFAESPISPILRGLCQPDYLLGTLVQPCFIRIGLSTSPVIRMPAYPT